jgi:hypothetical protein
MIIGRRMESPLRLIDELKAIGIYILTTKIETFLKFNLYYL